MALYAFVRTGEKWGVFIDFCSLPQHLDPGDDDFRTPEEEATFKQALAGLGALYSHPQTTCFIFTSSPPTRQHSRDGPRPPEYRERGCARVARLSPFSL